MASKTPEKLTFKVTAPKYSGEWMDEVETLGTLEAINRVIAWRKAAGIVPKPVPPRKPGELRATLEAVAAALNRRDLYGTTDEQSEWDYYSDASEEAAPCRIITEHTREKRKAESERYHARARRIADMIAEAKAWAEYRHRQRQKIIDRMKP